MPAGGGTLCIDPGTLIRYANPFTLDAQGAASVHANWGRAEIATRWVPGSTWVLQAFFRDGASGFNTTGAMRVTFNG